MNESVFIEIFQIIFNDRRFLFGISLIFARIKTKSSVKNNPHKNLISHQYSER